MEDRSKQHNQDAARRDQAQSGDQPMSQNPGLKEQGAKGDSRHDGLFNEDPIEEKRAIEETSEDRLSEAE